MEATNQPKHYLRFTYYQICTNQGIHKRSSPVSCHLQDTQVSNQKISKERNNNVQISCHHTGQIQHIVEIIRIQYNQATRIHNHNIHNLYSHHMSEYNQDDKVQYISQVRPIS